ncbi:APG9-domain-containing protein [Parathielavia hyrcaniae]|uniref:Autophagy-related protein 9 n=1 Tax=Parathielavia hyrcaniae TaxID=113614 RepID=A0AAN6Q0B4_9PEZI|nr:APG9-domain-containing protein [Parathielavia hyrcaniae]
MASNVFSRLVPTAKGRSFYEDLRRRQDDTEDQAGLLDEQNLNHNFHDYDIGHAEGLGVEDSRTTAGDVTGPTPRGRGHPPVRHKDHRAAWASQDDDGDNDVPTSLLVECHDQDTEVPAGRSRRSKRGQQATAIPGSSRNRQQWEATQAEQRLHGHHGFGQPHAGLPNSVFAGMVLGNAKKKAEWRWANIQNLDNFMKDVYDYYLGNGMWCILVDRALHLVNVAFVAVLLTFLSQCIDYGKLRGSQKLSQILVPKCTKNMSGLWNLGLWMFAFYFIWKSIQYLLDLRRLKKTRDFYLHMLDIPDQDMQTITWQEVVARIMTLRDINPKTASALTHTQRHWVGNQSKERLDASDIANRLMRRENYLIALVNKDVLNLVIPLPFLRNRQLFSRTMEWVLMFSILDFVFDDSGQVNQEFLKSERRGELSLKLRGRFIFAGLMILILSPFLAGYLLVVYFLMYYHEIQRNPSVLSSRTYTPLAEWKFREFNELPHLFRKRLDMSHPFAGHYIDQFPKVKMEMLARTVAFISGALATVLAIASVADPELFLGFEITTDRTVLFYTAVFGSVWAFARGSISEENSVFDPEYAMRNVIQYTHYEPDHWEGRLHSADIKQEFSELYKIKVAIFVEEILSILTTPFVLFSSLPTCSDQIIDFFREFTVHVDGLGYVCTFAEFDFKKGIGKAKAKADAGDVREEYYSTKHGKMEASYYGFMGNYGNFAINPRTGAASHLPPGTRNQFHPPPAWPSINSPPTATDLQSSRMERDRTRGAVSAAKVPRHSTALAQSGPMASILLDPHHQPPSTALHPSRSIHAARHPRGGHQQQGVIEETLEDDDDEMGDAARLRNEEEDIYESEGGLDESAWQTSPARTLSRENSAAEGHGPPEAGVVHMIYQFNQAQLNRRPGGVR